MHQSLDKQIYQHNEQKKNEVHVKQILLQQAKNNAFAEEQRIKEQKDRQKVRQEEYAKMLDAQVEQRRINNRQEMGMNEYERRVNEAAINAQERHNYEQIPYKLPGIKRAGEERQEKVLDRVYGQQSVDFTKRGNLP